ncbi:nitrate reductase molybdenum cofactor assembly chaperone [Arcanobacterium ihumii]|uniref:nitrate reductase molybdenum cofactor assembly chaperone n=1 Tax=Arcanobacterium ihumii TaxID=2138162 RepID=UPI000F53F572|nr:nitrate reductase molybdenum cofactor assembly chaperone [Arcanobacterium ihumii]
MSSEAFTVKQTEADNSHDAGPVRTAHMIASVLLDYPSEDFMNHLDIITTELDSVDPEVAQSFERFIEWARNTPQDEIETAYVETFDQKRKCNLYLSYYSTGDTRLRGTAILTFQQAFEAVGWKVTAGELPDYLPAVLELSARTGDELATHLVNIHREGLEVLRAALTSLSSPWQHVVDALILTLPPLDKRAEDAFKRLVMQGPPAEMVGVQELPFPTTNSQETRR